MKKDRRTKLDLVLSIARQRPTTSSEVQRRLQTSLTSARSYLEALIAEGSLRSTLVVSAKVRGGERLYFVPGDEERANGIAGEMRNKPGAGYGSSLFVRRRAS